MDPGADRYIQELTARPEVAAVILFGSRARGDNRPDSDVDLIVLVPQGYRRATEERDGRAFELIFLSEEVAREYFLHDLDTAADFWASARILFERDDSASRLRSDIRQVLAAGKPALDAATLRSSRFNSEDQLRAAAALGRHDPASAALVLHNKVIELTGSYFDVRQRWTPGLKRRLPAIAEDAPALHSRLTAFYAAGFDQQLALAREMVALVYDA